VKVEMLRCAQHDRRYSVPFAVLQFLYLATQDGEIDALAVGLLTSYVLEGRSLAASVLRAQLAARHSCSLKASSDGLVSPAQLEAYARH
jgi:hypothetical protein